MALTSETMAPTIIAWQEPPPRQQTPRGAWLPVLATLRTNPGQWALVRQYQQRWRASSFAGTMRTRYPEYEWAARDSAVYCRFAGDSEGAS